VIECAELPDDSGAEQSHPTQYTLETLARSPIAEVMDNNTSTPEMHLLPQLHSVGVETS